MDFAPTSLLRERGEWLSVPRMALWDWEKAYNPEKSPPGERVKSGTCTSIRMFERLPGCLAGLTGEGLCLPKPIHNDRKR